jgi:ADP-heptose:LPS heptosyltransferase
VLLDEFSGIMNIRLMKLVDAVIGRIAALIISPPAHRNISSPIASLLIIRPGGIGDAVLLAPAILDVKKKYPAIQITILAEQRNAGAFALVKGVDKLLCYDRPREFLQALICRYDVVIDTEQSHRLSGVVARIVSAPVKIGFATNKRRRMFNYHVSYSHDDYESASFAHLIEPLGIEADNAVKSGPFLLIPEAATDNAAVLLGGFSDVPFVAVFPGASIPERRWGVERFRRVAETLMASGTRVVVVGGKMDRSLGDAITAGGVGLNLAGFTTLAETAAIIKKSSLLLSGDSGLLHIAVGLGVPTVSLFGPGRWKKWAPAGEFHIVLNKQLPCSPCTTFGTTQPCDIGAKCMSEISVDQVLGFVNKLLTRDSDF